MANSNSSLGVFIDDENIEQLLNNDTLIDITTTTQQDVELGWEQEFRDSSRFWVQRILVPIVVLVGFLGNLVTITILTRKSMRSSTNVYLCALATSDLLFLLFTFTMSLSHYPDIEQVWFYWYFKRIGLWLTDAASSTSVWITVSFTIERYIAVCHPIRGKIFCTENRAIKVAITVYLLCFALTSPTPFEWKLTSRINDLNTTVYTLEESDFARNEVYRITFFWFTSIIFILLPVVILAIFNFFLIQAVRRSRQIRKSMTDRHRNSSVRHIQTIRQENRITMILIGVVIVFLICNVPTAVVLIYTSIHIPGHREEAILRGLGNIFNFLVAFNAACNFLLYTALSDKYRKYFCAFFCCRKLGLRSSPSRHPPVPKYLLNNGEPNPLCSMHTQYSGDGATTWRNNGHSSSMRVNLLARSQTARGARYSSLGRHCKNHELCEYRQPGKTVVTREWSMSEKRKPRNNAGPNETSAL